MKRYSIFLLSILAFLVVFLFGGCSTEFDDGADSTDSTDITQESISGAWDVTGRYLVANMEELLALEPAEAKAVVMVEGYYTPGDGGGGIFYYRATSRVDADGGTVVKGTAAKGRFLRSYEGNAVNVKWFGAKGDGQTDDTAALQAAIDALPLTGGTVIVPGGIYPVSATLQIGNGDGGEKVSSQTAVKFIGMGSGFADGSGASTSIIATAEMDSVIAVNGRISDVEIAGLNIDGNGLAESGLYLYAFAGGYFHNLTIQGFRHYGLNLMSGVFTAGSYNIYNRFESIGVLAENDGSTCLSITGTRVNNGNWLMVFSDCQFDTVQTQNSIAGFFQYVDNVSFYRCRFLAEQDNSVGTVFDGTRFNNFPGCLAFYDCCVSSTQVIENENLQTGSQYFYGFCTEHGETIPTHSKLFGITDKGDAFNMDELDVFQQQDGSENAGEYWLISKSGRVDTFTKGYPEKRYNLAQDNTTVAVLVNAKTQLIGATFYLSSFNTKKGTVTASVYEWNTDYDTTVKGEVKATASVSDFADNSQQDFTFDGLGTGYYLIVLTGTAPEGATGVACWTQSSVDTSITFVNGEKVAAGLRGSFLTLE